MGATRSVMYGTVVGTLAIFAGCGHKKPSGKTTAKSTVKDTTTPPPPPETEADREQKRAAAAAGIIPDGSTCLPEVAKSGGARLDLGAVDGAVTLCVTDTDKSRLLGPIGCFTVDVGTNSLAYKKPAPIPGLGFDVKMDDHCARGYCLPVETVVPNDKIAHITWNTDGNKVAVLAGDMVHLFDAATKGHESAFAIRGDKGVTGDTYAIDWVGNMLFVEGGDAAAHGVWAFKADGTATGAIEELGGKPNVPLLMKGGALSILDKERIGLSQDGLSTLTSYETASGKRAKVVRKVPKAPCKPEEMDAYWKDPGSVSDAKCKEALDKTFGYLLGASGFAGAKNLVFTLHGGRTGGLGLFDPKTLVEQKKIIKLPFCGEAPAAK